MIHYTNRTLTWGNQILLNDFYRKFYYLLKTCFQNWLCAVYYCFTIFRIAVIGAGLFALVACKLVWYLCLHDQYAAGCSYI